MAVTDITQVFKTYIIGPQNDTIQNSCTIIHTEHIHCTMKVHYCEGTLFQRSRNMVSIVTLKCNTNNNPSQTIITIFRILWVDTTVNHLQHGKLSGHEPHSENKILVTGVQDSVIKNRKPARS